MRKTVAAILLLTSLGWSVAAQEDEQQAKPKPIPAAVKARLSKLLPDLAAGVTAEPAQFYSSNLYEYIDGGAEAFHMYDMLAMVHREYKAKGTEITVDIYDMGEPLNAFGIYAAERSPDYHFIAIGAEGYSSEQTLNFLQGAFYVKLSAFGGSTGPVLDAFAKGIAGRIGTGKSMPAVLAFFPAQNLVARSEKYVKKAPLGHDFLEPAAMATYKFNGKESTVVVSLAKNVQEAKGRASQLQNHFGKSGKVAPAPEFGPNVYRGSNSYEGEMVFLSRGPYMVLFINPPQDAAGFVKQCVAKIPEK
jgi:hypothetical protein